jgi:3-oxoacyl-[acyl-carrier-protein] synthase II
MKSDNDPSPRRRVVITGLGVVAPNGIGTDAYRVALRDGVSGVGAITLFDAEDLECRIAAEVKNLPTEISLTQQEARRVGRAVPLLRVATEEALRGAGVCWPRLSLEEKQSWGVVIGSGGGTPDFTEEQYRRYFSDQLGRVSAYNISSSTPGGLSSEVSLHFDFHGPSHLISTGCTSSTDALGYAFNMIRFGLADHLVSGGADATITPGIMRGFCVMRVVSASRNFEPERASRPFDQTRDGFVLGEGAWVLVLEERERALNRGAKVHGEILGYGSTCDAYHRVRLNPNGEEPARAMQLAIEDAKLAKDEIGYIALHGTSTSLNDRTETLATKLCFGARAYDMPMSSIKSMIGHTMGAASAIEAAVCALAVAEDRIPPTMNLDEPEDDLDYVPNRARETRVRLAMNNAYAFGGNNASVILRKCEL